MPMKDIMRHSGTPMCTYLKTLLFLNHGMLWDEERVFVHRVLLEHSFSLRQYAADIVGPHPEINNVDMLYLVITSIVRGVHKWRRIAFKEGRPYPAKRVILQEMKPELLRLIEGEIDVIAEQLYGET